MDVLNSLLDFIYFGQVEIRGDQLDKFMALANELKVKGLSREKNLGNGEDNEENKNPPLEASDKEEESSIIINETTESTSFQEKTKTREDPGFEIIKEVPCNSGGMPRMMGMGLMGGLMAPYSMQGMFKDAGHMMMGSMLGGQGLGAQGNPKKRKCKYFNFQYTSRSS